MADESASERLAKLKARGESLYNEAQDLRYIREAEPPPNPDPVAEVEALWLSEPDPAREYLYYQSCREHDRVCAVITSHGSKYSIRVTPRGSRRFTAAAWVELGARGVDGLGAVAYATGRSQAQSRAASMVEAAERDACPTRRSRALSSTPQQWVDQLRPPSSSWIEYFKDNLQDGPVRFWGAEQGSALEPEELEVYQTCLEALPGAAVYPVTGVPEGVLHHQDFCPAEVFSDYRIRNQSPRLFGTQGRRWESWDAFHRRFPEARGLVMFSSIGWGRETAFVTACLLSDPRLLQASNAAAETQQFMVRFWLRRNGSVYVPARDQRWPLPPLGAPEYSGISAPRHASGIVTYFLPLLDNGQRVVMTGSQLLVGDQAIAYQDIEEWSLIDSGCLRLETGRGPFLLHFRVEGAARELYDRLNRLPNIQ